MTGQVTGQADGEETGTNLRTPETPLISVIVPFLDAAVWLPRCLEGLARQTFPAARVEFLFADNNSSDDGPAIVRQHTWIQLLTESSQGAYAARNRAARYARGDILAFLDPDCVPAPDWLHRIATGMEDRSVGILIGVYTLADRPWSVRPLVAYENEKTCYAYESGDATVYFGHTNNMAIRASLLAALGGFVERSRGSDTIFVRRAVEQFGTEVARADDRLLVSHLEIDSVATYCRKMLTYARSRESYRDLSVTRSLTLRERLRVFIQTARRNRYGLSGISTLFILLAYGLTWWEMGRLRGRLERLSGARAKPDPTRTSS